MKLTFTKKRFAIHFEDGRILSIPLKVFQRLLKASEMQKLNYRFIGNDISIYWANIDKNISIEGLLHGRFDISNEKAL